MIVLCLIIIFTTTLLTAWVLRVTAPRAPEQCADCGAPAWNRWSDGRPICATCADALLSKQSATK